MSIAIVLYRRITLKIDEIISDRNKCFRYMERYINDGSPSGYNKSTSKLTCPKSKEKGFYLYEVYFEHANFIDYGRSISICDNNTILLHPDVAKNIETNIIMYNHGQLKKSNIFVTPTSSGRTVHSINPPEYFFKLHYNDYLGRHNREMKKRQASSGIEVSRVLEEMLDENTDLNFIGIYRELSARVVSLHESRDSRNTSVEIGFVIREDHPYPKLDIEEYIIPGFSLFANNGPDDKLLIQIIEKFNHNPREFLFQQVITMLIKTYFNILLKTGLQLEAHAQNILFDFDKDFNIKRILIRDMESIDRDISLSEYIGKPLSVTFDDYKTLSKDPAHYNSYRYHKMHSFMYDFKFGEYLLTPIIDCVIDHYNLDREKLIYDIKELSNSYINQLPNDFFPSDGKWYYYKEKTVNRKGEREYLSSDYPKYR